MKHRWTSKRRPVVGAGRVLQLPTAAQPLRAPEFDELFAPHSPRCDAPPLTRASGSSSPARRVCARGSGARGAPETAGARSRTVSAHAGGPAAPAGGHRRPGESEGRRGRAHDAPQRTLSRAGRPGDVEVHGDCSGASCAPVGRRAAGVPRTRAYARGLLAGPSGPWWPRLSPRAVRAARLGRQRLGFSLAGRVSALPARPPGRASPPACSLRSGRSSTSTRSLTCDRPRRRRDEVTPPSLQPHPHLVLPRARAGERSSPHRAMPRGPPAPRRRR